MLLKIEAFINPVNSVLHCKVLKFTFDGESVECTDHCISNQSYFLIDIFFEIQYNLVLVKLGEKGLVICFRKDEEKLGIFITDNEGSEIDLNIVPK